MLTEAFRWLLHDARAHGKRIEATFVCDCEPVVKMVNTVARSKQYNVRQLRRTARSLLVELRRHGAVTLVHHIRELNVRADALVNEGCVLPEVTSVWLEWHAGGRTGVAGREGEGLAGGAMGEILPVGLDRAAGGETVGAVARGHRGGAP